MKEQTWHIDSKQVPNNHIIVYEFKVYHFEWEMDGYAWVVLNEDKQPYIATTCHGEFKPVSYNFISENVIKCYQLIEGIETARKEYFDKVIDYLEESISTFKEEEEKN